MKNARPLADGGRSSENEVRAHGASAFPPSFRILELTAVSYNSKIATGRAEIEWFGTFEFEVFAPSGRPRFVAGKSVKSAFTNQYERTLKFDDDFAAELLEAIDARLSADQAVPT